MSSVLKRAAAKHHDRLKEVSLLIFSDTSHQTSFASVTPPLLSSIWRHFLPNHSLLWDLLSARTKLIQLMGQTLSICSKNGADWIQSLQTKAGKCTGRRRCFVDILPVGGYWWRQAKDAGFALVNTKVNLQALHFETFLSFSVRFVLRVSKGSHFFAFPPLQLITFVKARLRISFTVYVQFPLWPSSLTRCSVCTLCNMYVNSSLILSIRVFINGVGIFNMLTFHCFIL